MARKGRAGDVAYNARRRYGRAAERYLKKANASSGAIREKYRTLALDAYKNAMATYDPKQQQKISSRLVNVGAQLGIDTEGSRKEFVTKLSEDKRNRLLSESKQVLESKLQDPDSRREYEARTLLSSNVGHKIMGGLVDVWRDADDREQAILDYFNAESIADVIDILQEKLGSALFSVDDIGATYAVVVLQIQNAIADNTLIA